MNIEDSINKLLGEPQFAEIRQLAGKIVGKVFEENSKKILFSAETFSPKPDISIDCQIFRKKLTDFGIKIPSGFLSDKILYEELIQKISAQQVQRSL